MPTKPSNSQFSRIFDKIAPQYNSILNTYALSRRTEFIIKYAKGKCLEVGAGNGDITLRLKKKHPVVATDISPEMVKQIKKQKISSYVCDAEKLPFKNASFNTIIAAELIYYLNHPEKFIAEAYRVLKPNGRLIITSARNITRVYDRLRAFLRTVGFKNMYFDDQNRHFFTQTKLINLLIRGNFTIKSQKKAIIFPTEFLDKLNRIIEKSPFNILASFTYVLAKKS